MAKATNPKLAAQKSMNKLFEKMGRLEAEIEVELNGEDFDDANTESGLTDDFSSNPNVKGASLRERVERNLSAIKVARDVLVLGGRVNVDAPKQEDMDRLQLVAAIVEKTGSFEPKVVSQMVAVIGSKKPWALIIRPLDAGHNHGHDHSHDKGKGNGNQSNAKTGDGKGKGNGNQSNAKTGNSGQNNTKTNGDDSAAKKAAKTAAGKVKGGFGRNS